MKKKHKKQINQAIWIILAITFIGVIIYGGNSGWFKGGDIFNNYPPAPSEKLPDLENKPADPTCTLTVNPTTIISGSSFSISIIDGINTPCDIYISNGSEWRVFTAGRTDIDGKLTKTYTILSPGSYKARAMCGSCITNLGYLTINPKPITPEKTCSQKANEGGFYYKEPITSDAVCLGLANTECLKNGNIVSQYKLEGTCCLFKCISQPPTPPPQPPAQPTCTDADGGINYNIRGDCVITSSNLAHESCIEGTNLLEEKYCSNNMCAVDVHECANGCANGACINEPDPALITCSNHCLDIGYHGATIHTSSAGACWTDTINTCRMEFGLDAEASTYSDGCCCQECVGW